MSKAHIEILRSIIDTQSHSIDMDEAREAIETLRDELEGSSSDDFAFDFDGNEYRIIANSAIWDIYRDAIQNIVEDCYSDAINLDNVPSWIAVEIDWEQTAKNAYVDGYGHTFSDYDGSEENVMGTNPDGTAFDYWIFRTN